MTSRFSFRQKLENTFLGLSLTTLLVFPVHASDFDTAKKYFEEQNYQKSYELFSSLVESDYSSLDYSFYLAQSAAAIGKITEAIVAYERVLINHPGDTRSKLELGRLYYDLGEYTLSQGYFNAALNDQVPDGVRTNIDNYLEKIDQKSQLATLTGVAIIGAGYDSNINSAPYASSWYVPVFGADFTNTTDTARGFYHQEMAIINHHYDSDKKYGFDINNNILAYTKEYPAEHDYNILYAKYEPSIIFEYDQHRLETGLVFDHMHYGSEAYLNSYGLSGQLFSVLDNHSALKTKLRLIKRKYLQDDDDGRDSHLVDLDATYFQTIDNQNSWHSQLRLSKNTKESGNLSDVSYNAIELEAGMRHEFNTEITISGTFGVTLTDYSDKSAFFLDRRKDRTLKAAVDVSKDLAADLTVQTRAEWLDNDSNHAAYDYNKKLILVNLIKRF